MFMFIDIAFVYLISNSITKMNCTEDGVVKKNISMLETLIVVQRWIEYSTTIYFSRDL